MFTALFTIPQTWKQRKCPTMKEWIEKLWGIYRQMYMYISHTNAQGVWLSHQKMEILLLATIWMSLKGTQFSLVTQSCLTLCDPMNGSTPGLPVHHQLPEFTQTHAHWVSDAIQPSHPLVVPFASCPQSFPAPGSFQRSQLFPLGGQSIGVSASASVSMNIQDWFHLGWTGWISLQSKGLSRVFSNTTVREHSALSFLYSPTLTSIHDHWKNHSVD